MAVNNLIKRLQNIMRQDAGINGDAQRIEQMVWLFFLKVYDTQEETWEYKAEQARQKAVQLDSERKERQDAVQQLAEEEKRLSEELAPLRELKVSTEEVRHIGKAALGIVTVKKKDFELLQAQAAAYRAHQADLSDIQAARSAVAQQRADVQQLRRSEESRIVAAEKRAYSDTRTAIRCHESNAAEDARQAEAALMEAEHIRDENRKLHQENIQYRERLREREQAALDEYRRNKGAIEQLKRSEALSARLAAQITSMQKAQTDAATVHRQEITQMQEKLKQAIEDDYDIEFGKFNIIKGRYWDDSELKVTVKNTSDTSIKFYFKIEARDADDKLIDSDTFYTKTLDAGASGEYTIFDYVSSSKYEKMSAEDVKYVVVTVEEN